ncbi:Rhomboid family protein [Mucilaginibacter paludis DSM 18603]|uniref:Rhomboid family protein n=1 Tax=Mucilaginibacter paludis DSM 18603 TaxID=714943 RepID=H1YFB2_9SPHI|nr:rhomboid family intramembrane serine protease [Mucilaginibacter paludis]EHQ26251.1 Rhomboid family protein [Mucilaginibacter paludis DSM 18603]
MKQFAVKVKLILVPFLIITVCTTFVYTLLNWLLFVKLEAFSVDEFITNFVAPALIVGIAILIWLRPRVKLLNFKKRNSGDPFGGYMMLAWVAATVPICVTQAYITTATGTLTTLDHISQINKVPKTKYYKLTHFYVDKRLVRIRPTFKVTGKSNQDFDMAIYAPCPIFDSNATVETRQIGTSATTNKSYPIYVVDGKIIAQDALSKLNKDSIASISILKGEPAMAVWGTIARGGAVVITTKKVLVKGMYNAKSMFAKSKRDTNLNRRPVAWFAVKYAKTISNRLSPAEKEENYKEFAKGSEADFESKNLADFIYLDRMRENFDFKDYKQAILTKDTTGINPIIILSPINEPFELRNGNKFVWIFGSLGIGSAIFLIFLLFTPLKSDLHLPDKANDESFTFKDLQIFIPHEGYYATPIIIDLNIIIFAIMVCCGLGFISFDAPDLLKWGGNLRTNVIQGQYWRLLTNIFLHGGLMHVLMNMYGLLFVGIFLEPLMGVKRYTLAYIGTGILASIASIWWHPATVSIGASGAIFGMYGIFLALLTTNLSPMILKKHS